MWAGPEFHVLNLIMLAKATTLRIASLPFQGVVWILWFGISVCGPIRLLPLLAARTFFSWSSPSFQRPIPQRFLFFWPVYSPFSLVKAPFLSTKTSLFAGKTRYWAGGGQLTGVIGRSSPSHPGSLQAFRELRLMVASIVSSAAGAGKPPGLSLSLLLLVHPPFPSLWWSFGLVKLE